MKRSPLKRIGRRKQREMQERDAVVLLVHARDQGCQFTYWVMQAKLDGRIFQLEDPTGCWNPGELGDVHEIIPRSVWPKGYLEPDNCMVLCRAHHQWIDSHRPQATLIGLYGRTKP